jgi:hypothetical protein
MRHLAEDQNLTFTAEQRRYLSGPIVLHNPGWADTVPKWLTAAIPAARVEQVTAETAGEIECNLATLEEVCAYLYTASLVFPLNRDHAAIYLWATGQVLSRQGRVTSIESVFEMLGEIGVHGQTLTDYQEHEVLGVLQRDIRRSVARHAQVRKP